MGNNNIGALIIRIGFCGPVYYNYNKAPIVWQYEVSATGLAIL